jgi:hypothetical protein
MYACRWMWGVIRWVCMSLCCMVVSLPAMAVVPQQTGWQTWWDNVYRGAAAGATLDELNSICKGYGDSKWQAAGPPTMQTQSDGSVYSLCGEWVGSTWVNRGHKPEVKKGLGCPANSAPGSGGCQCNTGFRENAAQTACEPITNDCQQSAGQPAGVWRYDGGYGANPNPLASEICKAGSGARCIVKVTDPKCTQVRLQGVGNPFWSCRGDAYYTGGWGMGAACDRSAAVNGDGGTSPTLPPVTVDPVPDQLPPNTAAPTDCPPGTFEGTVNGTHMCVDDVSNPGQTKSPQTGQEVKKNPDGSTTTTTTEGTTKCSNGSCNTTNNTTTNITGNPNSTCPQGMTPSGPNGSASSCTGTSTSSSTQAQSQFCKENAGSAQCKDGESTFSGSCAGGFICKGDAIQCAMAQEQHRARCDYEKWDAPWKQNGIKDIQASGDISKEFYVNDGSSGNSAWTSWLGSTSVTAACPAGFPMQLLGEQYTLSLQPLCDVGEGARPVVIAVALLLALRTFLSVVTRD